MLQHPSTSAAPPSPASNGYRVEIGRGERLGRVASEWFTRPADQGYLTLTDLHRAARNRAERSHARMLVL